VKYKQIMLGIMLFFVFVVVCPYRVDGATYTAQELYEKEIHFVAFIDVNGDFLDIDYVQSETNPELWFLQVRKNGVTHLQYMIQYSGVDTGYFYVYKYEGGYFKVALKYWDGQSWIVHENFASIAGGVVQVGLPPMEEEGERDYLKDRIVINWPPYDGYMFSTAQQSIQYQFGFIGDDASELSFIIDGVNVWTAGKRDFKVIDGYIYGTCKDTISLNKGVNEITVYVTDGTKSLYANRMVILKQGIRDEDGDGLDDDTGEPIVPGGPDYGDGPPPLPGENATIFDYIKWFADSVIYSLGLLVTTIKSFMSGIGQVTRMFAEMFKWLPSELIAIMILGICMTIILRILGR
jgi:hypothetical protein